MSNWQGLKVLVVDDSPTIRRAAASWLSKDREGQPSGIVLDCQGSAKEAIQAMEKFQPDIVFTDVQMPGHIDGYTLCKAMKRNGRHKEVKVIIMTAKNGLIDKAKAVDAGADDFIEKPFKTPELCAMLDRYAPNRSA